MKLVKHNLQQQHCSLNDISIQMMVQSLTAMTLLHLHNSESKLQHTDGMQHSNDMVGNERRMILSETVSEADPFNMSRDPVQVGVLHKFELVILMFTMHYCIALLGLSLQECWVAVWFLLHG